MEQSTLVLKKTIPPRNFDVVFGDTDAIGFKKPDEKPFSEEEQEELLTELNSLLPEKIKFEVDGEYRRFIIVKKKNYLLDDGEKITVKGSGLKGSMKEPALQQFMKDVLELLRTDRKDQIFKLYESYVRRILSISKNPVALAGGEPIENWCKKVTITKAILEPDRTNEERILDAIANTPVNEGDKIFVFVKETYKEERINSKGKKTKAEVSVLELREKFSGQYCKKTLLSKLYKTLSIFKTIIDVSLFPNYSLSRNMKLLGSVEKE